MESILVVAKEPLKQLESMIIGRELIANGIAFMQHKINSNGKEPAKQR